MRVGRRNFSGGDENSIPPEKPDSDEAKSVLIQRPGSYAHPLSLPECRYCIDRPACIKRTIACLPFYRSPCERGLPPHTVGPRQRAIVGFLRTHPGEYTHHQLWLAVGSGVTLGSIRHAVSILVDKGVVKERRTTIDGTPTSLLSIPPYKPDL